MNQADKRKIQNLAVVIAAGGSGERFETSEKEKNKLLADLAGNPVFIHSIINFSQICPQENIILAVNSESFANFAEILKKYNFSKVKIVRGGETRMHSVFNALKKISDTIKFVAIHDAARPLATAKLLKDSFKFAEKHGSAVVAKKITDTIKKSDKNDFICRNIPRENLWTVETPQIFDLKKLIKAYEKAFSAIKFFTDDAGVMTHSGYKVKLFQNPSKNTKITFYYDLCEIRKYIH